MNTQNISIDLILEESRLEVPPVNITKRVVDALGDKEAATVLLNFPAGPYLFKFLDVLPFDVAEQTINTTAKDIIVATLKCAGYDAGVKYYSGDKPYSFELSIKKLEPVE